jgi:APA family basic amino acid/polyamine antiporter
MTAATTDTGQAIRQHPRALNRSLNFWQVTASGVGIIIGAGVYVLIGTATQEAGAAVWLAFVLAGLLSTLSALSYAELAAMFPSAGAEYEFARKAFNEFVGFVTGWMMVIALLIAAGTVSIGFAQYAQHFVEVDGRLASLVLLATTTAVIMSGIQRSIWLTVGLALLQVGGLLIVIVSGVEHVGDRSLIEGATIGGVLSGSALVFFAFIGFDEVVTLSEETRDPSRVIPRALLAGLAIATTLYVLVAIAAVSIVGAGALAGSERPLALVMEHDLGGRGADVVAAIALAATTNTTLLALTAASRNLYAMARSGSLPPMIGRLGRTQAPWLAALLGLGVAAVFAVTADIGLAASVTDFAVYGIFIVVNLSVIVLRKKHPEIPRTIAVPIAFHGVPVLPVAAIVTVGVMLFRLENDAWWLGGIAVVAGMGAWLLLWFGRRASRGHLG